ncbi:MAG TPA: hypothetical protein PLO23_09105, partial [Alphaproteobacteria bacterium]|nr:hypothetical protein [Alphaproteobacteria bacterium]
SKASVPEGKTEPHVALLMGLEGYGRLESYEVPVSAVEKFLDIVKQRQPQLARVNPDEARARFYDPGYVVYDPLKVIRIYQNGDSVNVRFTSPEDVDFNFEPEVVGQYLEAKYGPDSPHGDKQDCINQGTINKAYAFENKLRFRLQREFARKVAKAAPDLVRIEGSESILYTRFTNATRLEVFTSDRPDQKTKLLVFYQKDTPDSSGFLSHGQAHFKTPAAAVREVERLQA